MKVWLKSTGPMIGISLRTGISQRVKRTGRFSARLVRHEQRAVEEPGETGHEDVEHDTDDDLVDEVLDRERRQHEGDQHAADHRADEADERVLRDAREQRGAERAEEELPLDRHVDDADALADDTAERTEDERAPTATANRRAAR